MLKNDNEIIRSIRFYTDKCAVNVDEL